MSDVIMSHIFNSYYTHRALASIGSGHHVYLVDNSFCGEMATYCRRNPHVHYLTTTVGKKVDIDCPPGPTTRMEWHPLSCSASWNFAMQEAQADWVINVNPDTEMLPQSLELMEMAIDTRMDGVVLMRAPVNFNFWAADRKALLELGGFDERFRPCAGEDEDMLLRIGKAGMKWQRCGPPAYHQDGGHKDRMDLGIPGKGTYCNAPVFVDKWGFMPHSAEWKEIVGAAHAGGA